MAQPATPIGRREELFNRVVTALRQMPEDLREVFVRTHYRSFDSASAAVEIGVSERQLASRRLAAEQAFFANLEGRCLRILR